MCWISCHVLNNKKNGFILLTNKGFVLEMSWSTDKKIFNFIFDFDVYIVHAYTKNLVNVFNLIIKHSSNLAISAFQTFFQLLLISS